MKVLQNSGLKIADEETAILALTKFIGLRLLVVSCFIYVLTLLVPYLFI